MQETMRFRPQAVRWWTALMASRQHLRRVHVWQTSLRGQESGLIGLEQHPTDTLVLCLAGTTRIEDGTVAVDLSAGDALLVRTGCWHRHAPLRRGSLVYRQGVIAGRSDFYLEDRELRLVASWPEQPARRLLEAIGAAGDEDARRRRLQTLLTHLGGESAEPLPTQHPAALAMEYALWENLHHSDACRRIERASGLSRVQAWRVFRARFRCGIAAAVRRERMELARVLLVGGLPVARVAQRCGIGDASTFARAYRRHWGRAPSQDRLPAPPRAAGKSR